MARIPRILITGEPTAYHVISRTALDGYPIGVMAVILMAISPVSATKDFITAVQLKGISIRS